MSNSRLSPPASWSGTQEEYELAVAATLELQHQECERNPAYFISENLLTEDPQDIENPYKPFPDYPYLWQIVEHIKTERLLAIEKSRQVMVTWICAAYCLWLALFHSGVRILIQSQDQDDADEVIDKIGVLYNSMPAWMQARHPIKQTVGLIRTTTTRSRIEGIPEGPDQIRGPTPTLIWSDETAAQKGCAEAWLAMRPSLGSKGRGLFTSSAAPGWFHMLVSDKLEAGRPPDPMDHRQLCEGLSRRRLQRNKFTVLRLHYTADPTKRTEAWMASAKSGMTEAAWQQEMELNYDAKAGQPALPLFSIYRHQIVVNPFDIPRVWPRWLSCDFGTRSPSSIHAYTTAPDGTAYCYWEYYQPGSVFDFIEAIKSHPDFDLFQAIILDSACWKQDQNDQTSHQLRSIVDYMEDEGVYPIRAARVDDRTKIATWDKVWLPLNKNLDPSFKIFATCPNIVRELPGIVWAEYSETVQRSKNVREQLVDRDNHAFDDASYFLLHRYESVIRQADQIPAGDIRAMALEQARQARIDDEAKQIAALEERREQTGFYFEGDDY